MGSLAELRGHVAIVTGAGSESGIGLACAARLGALGARVVVTSTTGRIHQRVKDLAALGVEAHGAVADLTVADEANRLVEITLDRFGRLDILVNNAGMTSVADPQPTPAQETSPQETPAQDWQTRPDSEPDLAAAITALTDTQWHDSIARNLDTAFFTTRAALPAMLRTGYGRIVTVASVSGVVQAYRGDAAYHAAKAALTGLTRSTALLVAGSGITANAVAPGWIATGSSTPHELAQGRSTPVGRPGRPEEVAAMVAYLASPLAGFTTGQVLVIDGANSLAEERLI
ncbi:3-oxoacyl-[acyl-carrier protein] reductase [Streptacidiphilus sp. MAP12-16]|uniref:SDR family NAD(P)-dependent oxidoreductase n=1 Tax=Streptacidiphilus sp. MAP12-16 TaxID=3156300 RepID=UPI0035154424